MASLLFVEDVLIIALRYPRNATNLTTLANGNLLPTSQLKEVDMQ